MEEQVIKERLKRTWIPFFSRFGSLTEIQKKVIPKILEDKNLVIISPAATGKTEATVAPIVERLLEKNKNDFSILYVSPTRALVNDLYRRLQYPFEYLNLKIEKKTGDRPRINEKKLPFILLTTPESFDSLLSRHTQIFTSLSYVILDEIHLLDNTPRGDQLRILLNRLRRINSNIKYYALSATIDDKNIGERYFSNWEICEVPLRREIEEILIPEKEKPGDGLPLLYQIFLEKNLNKILFFFNARSTAEMFVPILKKYLNTDKVWVHHASLTKQKREEVEKLMEKEKKGVLCATTTLELGIDIGDIDCVVLYRPPFNVSSLLQRIGRGNRRREKIFAVGIYKNNWERLLFEIFFECAKEGRLYERYYNPSLAVIPQQIFSYLYQRRRIGTTFNSLRNIFNNIYDEEIIKKVLGYLLENEYIKTQTKGVYFLSEKLENLVNYGRVHSNIQQKSFGEYELYDIDTEKKLGYIFYPQPKFIFGGITYELVEIRKKEKRIYARKISESEATSKLFEGTGTGGYFFELAKVIKKKIFPNLAEWEFPFFVDQEKLYLFHFLGSLYGSILAMAYKLDERKAIDLDGKVFLFEENYADILLEKRFPKVNKEIILTIIENNLFILEDALGSGGFFRYLPKDLQIYDHYLRLDIERLFKFLDNIQLVEITKDLAFVFLEGYI